MNTLLFFRVSLVIAGLLFLWLDFIAYARQKLTENIGMGWAVFALLLIVIGAVPGLSRALGGGSGNIDGLLLLTGVFLLIVMFFLSMTVSMLRMRNRELAMQVSLLNQENEKILKELGRLLEQNSQTKE